MAHPLRGRVLCRLAAPNHGYMFRPILVTPPVRMRDRSQGGFATLPLGPPGERPAAPGLAVGSGYQYRRPAAGRLRLVLCRPADRQSACRRPSFEGGFLLFPLYPVFHPSPFLRLLPHLVSLQGFASPGAHPVPSLRCGLRLPRLPLQSA